MPQPSIPQVQETALNQKPRLLWDWPTRILHWSMAGLFLGAFSLAILASEHSRAFVIHAALGILLGVTVMLRLIWGVAGSKPSRFGSFLYSPMSLFRYVRDAMRGNDRPTPGHNAGSSYAIYAMLVLPLGLAGTGVAMGRGLEWAEDVHGALAYAMVAVIVLHILGLAWHTHRHREAIALSMIHGLRRMGEPDGIPSARPVAGLLAALVLCVSATLIARGLDLRKGTLTLPGTTNPVVLKGEDKAEGIRQEEGHRKAHEDDD